MILSTRAPGFFIGAFVTLASGVWATPYEARAAGAERMAALPVPFVENSGQTAPDVAYRANMFAGAFYVTRDGKLVHSLPVRAPKVGAPMGWSLVESFVDGRPQPRASVPALTRVSYFIGNDPSAWRADVPTHEEVALGTVWPGIDVRLRAYGNRIEKIYTVAPHGSARAIRMRVAGATRLRVAADGVLEATTGLGIVRFSAPFAFQDIDGRRRDVAVGYFVRGDQYGFRLGAHDRRHPVVIDPILQSTYLGGSGNERGFDLAIHSSTGEVYVAGDTTSTDFPGTAGGAFPTRAGMGTFTDAFVARLNPQLTALLQATYYGGADDDLANAIVIHPTNGDIYIAGATSSTNLPVPGSPAQGTPGGTFIARFNAALTSLVQGTYAGGDFTLTMTADPATGDVFIGGVTNTSSLPAAAMGAYPTRSGVQDAFITRANAALTSFGRSTYFGGVPGGDQIVSITVHPATGDVYAAGVTTSPTLPGTAGGAQPVSGSANVHGFVARFNNALTTHFQASFLSGNGRTEGSSVIVHPTTGDVYVSGLTQASNFPQTAGGGQMTNGGADDAFITRMNAALTSFIQSTYFGGNSLDFGNVIVFNAAATEIYVGGVTQSGNLPGVAGGAQTTLRFQDVYAARFNAALTNLVQSTYYGGSGSEYDFADDFGMAIHPTSGELYIASTTVISTNLPGAACGFDATLGGSLDAFVVRLSPDLRAAAGTPADTIGLFNPATQTFFLRNSNNGGPADLAFGYGFPNAVPLKGDWNGDCTDTIGVYDPSTGMFYLRNTNTPGPADISFQFGAGGAVPLAGDWDGDGVDTIGIYIPATGTFFLRNSNSGGVADVTFSFGAGGAGRVPITGDWNNDGTDTIGLYIPATGVFFLRNSNSTGVADLTFTFGPGGGGRVPITGDWDNNGSDTIGLYVVSNGVFFLKNTNSSGAANAAFTFGGGDAVPLAGDWDNMP